MNGDQAPVTVAVLGQFPPPVTGAAKNTEIMYDALRASGVNAIALRTSVSGFAMKRSLNYHAARARQFFETLGEISKLGKTVGVRRLYTVPDGGLGVWYTLGYVLRGRAVFNDFVLHHRTCQYIGKKSVGMDMICRVLGRRALHVFLSERMAEKFQALYGRQDCMVSTNARYVTPRNPSKSRSELVLGHLSNLCWAKGFYEVVETFERLHESGLAVRLLLAGPVVEEAVGRRLEQLQRSYLDLVEYLGPLGGDEKDAFYDRVHVFLFPTKWRQEAQPNVLYEAMAAGASVVSYDRGCIGEMVPEGLGLVVPEVDDFVARALAYVRSYDLRQGPTGDAQMTHIYAEKENSESQYNRLLRRLKLPGPRTS